jgi:hypothetical protein
LHDWTGKRWHVQSSNGKLYASPDGAEVEELHVEIDPGSDDSHPQQFSNELRRIAKWYLAAAQKCDFENGLTECFGKQVAFDHVQLIDQMSTGLHQIALELEHLNEVAVNLESDVKSVPNSLAPRGKLPIAVYEDHEHSETVLLDDPREEWCRKYDEQHGTTDSVTQPNYALPGVVLGSE